MAVSKVGFSISAASILLLQCMLTSGARRTESVRAVPVARILVGRYPTDLALGRASDLYVANSADNSVSVVDTTSYTVTKTIQRVCSQSHPTSIGVSPNGRKLIVGCMEGVCVISIPDGFVTKIPTPGPARDIAFPVEPASVYVAGEHAGLLRLDLNSNKIAVVHAAVAPEHMAMTPDGRFLYVNYQRGGPGGRPGYDVIGKFDAHTGALLRVITGFPNVGGRIAISPDGHWLWASAMDACWSFVYDHLGCPAAPAGLINVIDLSTERVVRQIVRIGTAVSDAISFMNTGSLALVGGQPPVLYGVTTFLKITPLFSSEEYASSTVTSGDFVYACVPERNQVAIVRVLGTPSQH